MFWIEKLYGWKKQSNKEKRVKLPFFEIMQEYIQ